MIHHAAEAGFIKQENIKILQTAQTVDECIRKSVV